MGPIATALQHHVQDAAGHLAIFGGVARDFHLELLHRIDVRTELCGGPADIAVVEAVYDEVRIITASTVDGGE